MLNCSVKTLPLKGKCKPNKHKEIWGKQSNTRPIHTREVDQPNFNQIFEHLEGDTIVGKQHKSAVITLVERLSKVIITLPVI